jgi:hypothetical protein
MAALRVFESSYLLNLPIGVLITSCISLFCAYLPLNENGDVCVFTVTFTQDAEYLSTETTIMQYHKDTP